MKTIASMTKQERVEIVNEIIKLIAITDRCFFAYKDKISEFELINNKLWFKQARCQNRIRPYNVDVDKFEKGGTLWGLVLDMREFIMQGRYRNGHNGYGGLYCSHWGYTKEGQEKIILRARELGYL
jgi:hypothetical protein